METFLVSCLTLKFGFGMVSAAWSSKLGFDSLSYLWWLYSSGQEEWKYFHKFQMSFIIFDSSLHFVIIFNDVQNVSICKRLLLGCHTSGARTKMKKIRQENLRRYNIFREDSIIESPRVELEKTVSRWPL